jgi:RNA polymerase sigma factor (sigma-70 family)
MGGELLPVDEFGVDDPRERFGIVVTAKCRHAALWNAARKLGSNNALAAALGVRPTETCAWINLKRAPSDRHPRYDELVEKLLLFTGQSWSELWPAELREAIKGGEIGRRMEFRRSVEMQQLAELTRARLTAPDPAEVFSLQDRRDRIKAVLEMLSYREREILKLRYGLDGDGIFTLNEVARIFRVTPERVRQIEIRAIRKIQNQPVLWQQLEQFVGEEPA